LHGILVAFIVSVSWCPSQRASGIWITGAGAMQKLGLLDHAFYKADQYDVISMVMGGASIVAPARKSQPLCMEW